MSEYEYNDDDYDNDSNSGGNLRAQLEKVLKENKALKTETATLKSQIVERVASDALTAKGYPPAVARLAVKDGVDVADEKALDKWLTDNGELFVKPQANTDSGDGGTPDGDVVGTNQVQDPAIAQAVESTFGAIERIHSSSSPALTNKYQAALAGIPENASPEQVLAAMKGL